MPADTGSDLNQSSGGRGDPRTHLTRQWLEKAAHDLTAARLSQDASLADVVTFHCQQAAEKALKAYLTWRDEPFGKTHELAELVAQCAAHDSTFERLRPAAKVLAPYAIEPRSPGGTTLYAVCPAGGRGSAIRAGNSLVRTRSAAAGGTAVTLIDLLAEDLLEWMAAAAAKSDA